ncbi:hypothetical protein GCM10023205_22720 [Yinghuangia aomiensis]|uniref:Polyphosphate kinase-2-related domain-containing protein n=2 Tax=Yinghuangia aomiensis TaxID=676205 RepID=A0ABP9H2E6_9ACTN
MGKKAHTTDKAAAKPGRSEPEKTKRHKPKQDLLGPHQAKPKAKATEAKPEASPPAEARNGRVRGRPALGGLPGPIARVAPLRDMLRLHGGAVDLEAADCRATLHAPGGKAETLADTAAMGARLAVLQEKLYAQALAGGSRKRVLLVLQGMDTSGKGGVVKHVIGQFNPSGCQIQAFKAPTEEELAHPFLWRVKQHVPDPGMIGIFDRSHYEDVLIVRVHDLVPRTTWSRRYAAINQFEQDLYDDDVTVVKVFLHISYEEQRKRLLERLDNPDKHWKFNPGDIDERAFWPAYQEAYQAVLQKCTTDTAPWYVIPADRKWYRNWAISRLLLEHLEEIDPQYPKANVDVDKERRRLMET